MGTCEADQSLRFGEGDMLQVHFLRVLEGEDADWSGLFQDISSQGSAYRLTLSKIAHDRKAELKFCKNAKDDLKGTNWLPMIDRSIMAD